MASSSNNSKPQTYVIPPNFAREGTILGGAVRSRNAVEAVILCFPIAWLIWQISIGWQLRIALIILLVGPLAFASVMGINDSPISIFLWDAIKYLFSKKRLSYYLFGAEINSENKEIDSNRKEN